jgi:hypothetical protein
VVGRSFWLIDWRKFGRKLVGMDWGCFMLAIFSDETSCIGFLLLASLLFKVYSFAGSAVYYFAK